jgi:hypothetical protein
MSVMGKRTWISLGGGLLCAIALSAGAALEEEAGKGH